MIRFIIRTTVSKRDVSGNCYHADIITSTRTGKSLVLSASLGSDGGNTKAFLRNMGIDWEEMLYVENMMGIRDFDRRYKNIKTRDILRPVFEHELTKDMIHNLET